MPAPSPDLLTGLIDDAAVFPPGNAPLDVAVQRHRAHRSSAYAGCIGPLLVPASAAADLTAMATGPLSVGLIVRPGGDAGDISLARRMLAGTEVDVAGAECGWSKGWRESVGDGLPVALEIPRGAGQAAALDDLAVAVADGRPVVGKFRTGATSSWAWPDEAELAGVIRAFLDRGIPFKLTGGLHHATRGSYVVAGVPEENHGVLNVLMAVRHASDGADCTELADILGDRDGENLADAFARVADDVEYAESIRTHFVGFGCCEVTDPITEFVALGLLPPDHRPGGVR